MNGGDQESFRGVGGIRERSNFVWYCMNEQGSELFINIRLLIH